MNSKNDTLEAIRGLGLLAVIRGPNEDLTLKMVEALVLGGVRGIEITYTTPNAEDVVQRLAKQHGDSIVLGMGTLTETVQCERAQAAGAKFLVSPVCDAGLTAAMISTGLLVMAGALTPTEVLGAFRAGSDVVKLFPGSLVGPSYIKALHGPFPKIPLMPTGGVTASNVADWIGAGAVAVGAGSELCSAALAKAGRFEEISERARQFVQAVNKARAANNT